jgi:hypothetical protein
MIDEPCSDDEEYGVEQQQRQAVQKDGSNSGEPCKRTGASKSTCRAKMTGAAKSTLTCNDRSDGDRQQPLRRAT